MLVIVIVLKTFYLNIAPQSPGIHSMLTESLLVTHVACENLTSPLLDLHLARVYSTFLVLSLISRLLKSSSVYNAYPPNWCLIIFNGIFSDDFGKLESYNQSHNNNQESNGEEVSTLFACMLTLVCFLSLVIVTYFVLFVLERALNCLLI